MSKRVLMTLVAAIVLLAGMFGHRTEAMPLAGPSTLGIEASAAALIHKTTVVCGNAGCYSVQTKRVQGHQMPKSAIHPSSS
jgi:aspartate aminotransferase-like enzyme